MAVLEKDLGRFRPLSRRRYSFGEREEVKDFQAFLEQEGRCLSLFGKEKQDINNVFVEEERNKNECGFYLLFFEFYDD